jgi:hypothetical protein
MTGYAFNNPGTVSDGNPMPRATASSFQSRQPAFVQRFSSYMCVTARAVWAARRHSAAAKVNNSGPVKLLAEGPCRSPALRFPLLLSARLACPIGLMVHANSSDLRHLADGAGMFFKGCERRVQGLHSLPAAFAYTHSRQSNPVERALRFQWSTWLLHFERAVQPCQIDATELSGKPCATTVSPRGMPPGKP